MKATLQKITLSMIMVMFIMAPAFVFALPAMAQTAGDVNFGQQYAADIGLTQRDPRDVMRSLIQIIMTFLSIIAVAIILLGGFKWMTAAGNDDKVAEARKLIMAGIIGLIIIIAAWAITNFVLTNITAALNE